MAFVTVTANGPTLFDLINADIKRSRTANRALAKEIRKVGVATVRKDCAARLGGGLRFGGYRLSVRSRATVSSADVSVEIYGTPAGFWSILEAGARPHKITARRKKALSWGSGDDSVARSVNHPGVAGRRVWSQAEPALRAALDPVIGDTYGEVVFESG